MHAEKCPVCKGIGRLNHRGVDKVFETDDWKACHGCDGKGWITVAGYEEYKQVPCISPYQPWIPPNTTGTIFLDNDIKFSYTS